MATFAGSIDENEAMAREDPLAFLHHCRLEYTERDIRDYTCTFTTQQLVPDGMTPVQEAHVRFRESPHSIDMKWTRNPTEANRALYVENKWVDEKGRELAWFKPAGAVARLFVPKIKQPINGTRANAASRRSLNQFGFKRTLDLLIKYSEKARNAGDLELEYIGRGKIDGRPTYVFERRLPYTGEEEPHPDALLRYHIDREWLVPTACYSFADDEGRRLLGSYVLTDVEFNTGLDHKDFDPDHINF